MTDLTQENLETTTETLEQESRDHAAAYERLWKRIDEQDRKIDALSLELLSKISSTNSNLLALQARVMEQQPQRPAQANCPKCGAMYRQAGGVVGERSCPKGCGGPRF
jgi:hypothetical protein